MSVDELMVAVQRDVPNMSVELRSALKSAARIAVDFELGKLDVMELLQTATRSGSGGAALLRACGVDRNEILWKRRDRRSIRIKQRGHLKGSVRHRPEPYFAKGVSFALKRAVELSRDLGDSAVTTAHVVAALLLITDLRVRLHIAGLDDVTLIAALRQLPPVFRTAPLVNSNGPGDQGLRVTVTVPSGMSSEDAITRIVELYRALDFYHRASGGSGLLIDDLEVLEREPSVVLA